MHDLAKKKAKMLEGEMETVLKDNQELERELDDVKGKFDRLASLIRDIWLAEVQGGSTSFGPIRDEG